MLTTSDCSVELIPEAARLAALLDRLADENLTLADSAMLCDQIRGLVDNSLETQRVGTGRPHRSRRSLASIPT